MREGPSRGRENQLKYGDWLRASTIERQKVHFQRAGSPTKTEQSSDGDKEGMSRSTVRRDRETEKDKVVGDQHDSTYMTLRERRDGGVQTECQEKEGEFTSQKKSNQNLIAAAEVLTEEGGSGAKGVVTNLSSPKFDIKEGDVTKLTSSYGNATKSNVMDCQLLNGLMIEVEGPRRVEPGKGSTGGLIHVDGVGPGEGSIAEPNQMDLVGVQEKSKGAHRCIKWKWAARSPNKKKKCISASPLKQMLGGTLYTTGPKNKKLLGSPKSKKKLALSPKVKVEVGVKRKSEENLVEKSDENKSKCSRLTEISAVPGVQGCWTP